MITDMSKWIIEGVAGADFSYLWCPSACGTTSEALMCLKIFVPSFILHLITALHILILQIITDHLRDRQKKISAGFLHLAFSSYRDEMCNLDEGPVPHVACPYGEWVPK